MAYTKHEFQSYAKLYATQLNEMDEQIAKNEEELVKVSEESVKQGKTINGLSEEIEAHHDYTNLADPDAEGWLDGYDVGGGGVEVVSPYKTTTNYIPVSKGDIISCFGAKFDGSPTPEGDNAQIKFALYDADKKFLTRDYQVTLVNNKVAQVAVYNDKVFEYIAGAYKKYDDGSIAYSSVADQLAYIRVVMWPDDGIDKNDIVITRNEDIVFVKSLKDRITDAENEINTLTVRTVALEDKTTELADQLEQQSPLLTSDLTTACKNFSTLVVNTEGNADAFLFFTDPHLINPTDVKSNFYEAMNEIAAVYNNAPISTCVCGGDWLNSSNTKDNASWLLGKIDGAMKCRFKDYILILGNHDTNYQGYEYIQSGAEGIYDRETHEECILSNAALHNIWYRDKDALYFDVKIDSGTYYVFDTGLDWYPDMDEYRWQQIDWFATRLTEDDHINSAGLLHIVKSGTVTPFAQNIAAVANAYNQRTTITLNGKTYNFSASTGCFRFMMSGHTHADEVLTVNGIPVVITTNLRATEGVYSFDLVLSDYGAKTLHIVRVGNGENRTVTMADAL